VLADAAPPPVIPSSGGTAQQPSPLPIPSLVRLPFYALIRAREQGARGVACTPTLEALACPQDATNPQLAVREKTMMRTQGMALAVRAFLAFAAAGSGAAAAELSAQDQALLRKVVAANQRLEQALPLSSFCCEYTRTWEVSSQQPDGTRRSWRHKTKGTFAFERGGDRGIGKLAVEEVFLAAKTEPVAPGSRSFQAGDRTKTMLLGDTHYDISTTGGFKKAIKATEPGRMFGTRRYSPWNMLFDFKAEPLTQLDKPERVRVMVSIGQHWVGPARVIAIRREEYEKRPTVKLEVDFSGLDPATGSHVRIRYVFRLAEDMDFLPVHVQRTREVLGRDGIRHSGVTTVEKAIRLETLRGPLWIPARISDTGTWPDGWRKKTYELHQETVQHGRPVPAAFFAFDPTGADFYRDADAEREKKRRREVAKQAYKAKYGTGKRVRAPGFPAVEWYGEAQSLDALKGKVVLVVFWGRNCGRCLEALPAYEPLRKQHGSDQFEIVALHCQEADREQVLALMKKDACDFPVGQANSKLTLAYAVELLPAYYLLDKTGRLVAGRLQELPSAKEIRELLAE
jgi:thiol-disulfide isomerase/thioredoxin